MKPMTRALAAACTVAVLSTGVMAGPAFAAAPTVAPDSAATQKLKYPAHHSMGVKEKSLDGYRGYLETLLTELDSRGADTTDEAPETPDGEPTEEPTETPTEEPTEEPTEAPTEEPTEAPTEAPTEEPTEAPTEEPTEAPTETPTEAPDTRDKLLLDPIKEYVKGLETKFEVTSVTDDFRLGAPDTTATRKALDSKVEAGFVTVDLKDGTATVDLNKIVTTVTPEEYPAALKKFVDEAIPDYDDHRQAAADAYLDSTVRASIAADGELMSSLKLTINKEDHGSLSSILTTLSGAAEGKVNPDLERNLGQDISVHSQEIIDDPTELNKVTDGLWQIVAYNHLNSVRDLADSPFQAAELAKANTDTEAKIVERILELGDPWEMTGAEKPVKPAEPEPVALKDNAPGSAFHTPVQWMLDEGITVGYADGTFKKTKDVSRGETAAFLHRYSDVTEAAPEASPFRDVRPGGANFEAISWLATEGISAGYTTGSFGQSKPVTRGEFAAFLHRMEAPEFTAPTTSPFADLTVDGANYEAITWLAAQEITVGTKAGNFAQSEPITRGEMAALLNRFDTVVTDTADESATKTDTTEGTDK